MDSWIFLRDGRKPPFFWAANEVIDDYLPHIGQHSGFTIYMLLSRHADAQGRGSIRIEDINHKAGITINTTRAGLRLLERLKLIKRHDGRRFTYTLLPIPADQDARRLIIQEAMGSTIDPYDDPRDQQLILPIGMGSTIDPPMDQPVIPHGSTSDPSERDRAITSSRSPNSSRWDGSADGGKGSERPEPSPPCCAAPPLPPAGYDPVDQCPHQIAGEILGRALSRGDERKLNTLIHKHNPPTGAYAGGHGAYWVTMALLQADLSADLSAVPDWHKKVSTILRGWRDKTTASVNGYGSDLPLRAYAPPPLASAPTARPPAAPPRPAAARATPPATSSTPIALPPELDPDPETLASLERAPTRAPDAGQLRLELQGRFPTQRRLVDAVAISLVDDQVVIGCRDPRQLKDVEERVVPTANSLIKLWGWSSRLRFVGLVQPERS